MPRTLAEDVADDFTRVFLDTDHFAVTGVYTPKGGSARTITVQLSGINGGIHQDQNHLSNDRVLVLACRRGAVDGCLSDSVDGIKNPQIGDKWFWTGTHYSFDAVVGESDTEFFLRFKFIDRERTGNISAMRM